MLELDWCIVIDVNPHQLIIFDEFVLNVIM